MTMYYGIDMAATGANIKRLRQEHGLTVRDIQEAMGFDVPSAVYKWEQGRSLPSLEHLMALSKLFDVRMEDNILIWSRPPPGEVTEREKEVQLWKTSLKSCILRISPRRVRARRSER